mmetsp:Transcript_63965/g.128354  ORF Transcript_63965/g.128354 Transcript_63965/m.128354 type:complete len:140 (-) Transcript_63965:130-549(-)
MGAEASRPARGAGRLAATSLRAAGEPMNTLGYQVAHEKTFAAGSQTPHRIVVCRCWKSLKFPACDNSHFQLQREGVAVGPVMLEVKPGPTPVGAAGGKPLEGAGPEPRHLGGPRAAAAGGACALALAGASQLLSSAPFF